MAGGDRDPDEHVDPSGFDARDRETVEERERLRAPLIYEVLRREGEQEMHRPIASLWWSGVAAGLSISFSLLSQAILQTHLPDTPWRPLAVDLGYSVGFLMVVLARQQLFTENTILAVLPLAANLSWTNFARLGRMWSVVLAANLTGALFAAAFCTFTPVLTPELRSGMLEISRHVVEGTALEVFFRGVSAGFLIAAMVWLIPSAEGARFWVITMMTYLIAAGGFAHIVAGSVEAFMLALAGELGVASMIGHFILPALAGNIVGGSALFALISYAQVAREVQPAAGGA